MRIRPVLLLAPVVMAGASLLGMAPAARAAGAAPPVTHTPVTVGGQAFDLQPLAADTTWGKAVFGQLDGDISRLKALTGLPMPGGTIAIAEVPDGGLDDRGVGYDPATATLTVPQSVGPSLLAHALSHVWFNSGLFADRWVSEGLAGYSEQAAGAGKYTPCLEAGAYPGTGSANLVTWQALTYDSSIQDQNVLDWQYATSCAFFSTLAEAMGPANFKAVLQAAADGETAYAGVTAGGELPLSSRQVLDLFDERGMVASGSTDLDMAQNFLAGYGIFDSETLAARSTSRSVYHTLAARAGAWKMPAAVRDPMAGWDFPKAQAAMATTRQILDLRDQLHRQVPGVSLDGSDLRTGFESAATQTDLDKVFGLIKQLADAAGKIEQATTLRNGSHDILQTIGLLGVDLDTPLKQARADIERLKGDSAGVEAQMVIDSVNGAGDQGLMRIASLIVILALILLAVAVAIALAIERMRRRRATAPAAAPDGEES